MKTNIITPEMLSGIYPLIICGPSGVGKTAVKNGILKTDPKYGFSVSANTRAKRPNEENGKDYWFYTNEVFHQKKEQGLFIETEEVYPGIFYGTLLSEITRIISEGKISLLDIDVAGALNLVDMLGKNVIVVALTANEEMLLESIKSRGHDDDESTKMRLKKAPIELKLIHDNAEKFDLILPRREGELDAMVAYIRERYDALVAQRKNLAA
ncbi:MAG TPA: guanylate kinase [Candidatus Paceibacterota bacterium]|nr:guanylate kinase [Candidatus Paceibacterota bacterium]